MQVFGLPVCWWDALCFQQDVCCVWGAPRGRVLPAEERRHSGRKGHAHHSATRPDVPPPPLGAQRWGTFHWRERQTCTRHTQVTTARHVTLQKTCIIMRSLWLFPSPRHFPHGGQTVCTDLFCLCTDCMRWTFCLFCRHRILLASHSHSPFSHAWSCSCVSRAMFPETEQQAVSQMMARESNYPSAVLSAWWWGYGFLTLSLRRVNTV